MIPAAVRGGPWHARAFAKRILGVMLVGASAGACEYPFEPYQQSSEGPFSLIGYLDLRADTQWVRVMPVRQSLMLEPGAIDATVTLEHLATGRTVTLQDSLFRYTDARLEGTVYAHNFWTAERLEPGAAYQLRAERSDGAATTALIELPDELEFTYRNFGRESALLTVRAERVLYVDVLYAMTTDAGVRSATIPVRQTGIFSGDGPGTYEIFLDGGELEREGLEDARRKEIAIAVTGADWPFDEELSDAEVSIPGVAPSNVSGGYGFVGGVAQWTIPFQSCFTIPERPEQPGCTIAFDARSASVSGRVLRQPCGDPHPLAPVRLLQQREDGSMLVFTWSTGWDGEYRFEGITPGLELAVDLGPGTAAVELPSLQPGERLQLPDIAVPC